ncbi:hypothetical protein TNCV_121621 [Trichonephila clavipes]|nr:hypothetical protein TNCV_121621 [Trichonephila clavipes]
MVSLGDKVFILQFSRILWRCGTASPTNSQDILDASGTPESTGITDEPQTSLAVKRNFVECVVSPHLCKRTFSKGAYVLTPARSVVLWAESRAQGLENISLPFSFHAEIVEVEIGGVAIYRPFGEFRRAKSYCHLYGAQGQ